MTHVDGESFVFEMPEDQDTVRAVVRGLHMVAVEGQSTLSPGDFDDLVANFGGADAGQNDRVRVTRQQASVLRGALLQEMLISVHNMEITELAHHPLAPTYAELMSFSGQPEH